MVGRRRQACMASLSGGRALAQCQLYLAYIKDDDHVRSPLPQASRYCLWLLRVLLQHCCKRVSVGCAAQRTVRAGTSQCGGRGLRWVGLVSGERTLPPQTAHAP